MRKATLLLITLAVVICSPIVVTDIDGQKRVVVVLDDSADSVRQSPLVETESWRTFEMEIDGQKRVVVVVTQ